MKHFGENVITLCLIIGVKWSPFNQPIYFNNERVGLTTSGAYGYRIKKSLAFAYVKPETAKLGNEFLIDIQGKKIKATIIEEPAFDPENQRLKA